MTDDRKWCWRDKNATHASIPFDTRQQAIDAARDDWACEANPETPVTVMIGRCEPANPAFYAGQQADVDDMIESMEQHYVDNECEATDEVFFVKTDRKTAEAALVEALSKWADEHLESGFWCSANEEEVVINAAT